MELSKKQIELMEIANICMEKIPENGVKYSEIIWKIYNIGVKHGKESDSVINHERRK